MNTASITTEEIAKGVQSVGSVFADANTSVDEFIALLSAGNRQFQDADSLALGLRTSALRIRGCTAELEAMGEETDGVITSTSKLTEKIEAITNINGNGGVKILEADGETFRSIFDIYVDIGKVYRQMSDTDQSALLDLIAGKHRASGISATLNNMSEAQKIYQNSLNATGSAQEEYDKYLMSSEASLNKFKASMTETYQSIINGETTKGILDTGNATLQFANSIGLVESTLKGFIAIGIVKAVTTLSTAFKASAIHASNFATALNTTKNLGNLTSGTIKYSEAIGTLKRVSSGLSDVQLKQVLSSSNLSKSQRVQILQATGLSKAQAQAKLSQMGLTQTTNAQTVANGAATASTFSLSAAVKGFGLSLKAVFLSNPVGISIMALSTIIGVVSSKISNYNQRMEEAKEKAKELSTEYKNNKDNLNEQVSKYKELSEELKKHNLTADETKTIKEQLFDVQKTLLSTFGEEAYGIDLVNGKYQEQINKLDELNKKKAEQYLAENYSNIEADKKYLSNDISVDISPFEGLELSDTLKKYLGKNYKELNLREMGSRNGETFFIGKTELTLDKMPIENAYNLLSELWNDIDNKFGDGKDAKILKNAISNTLNSTFDKTKIDETKERISDYVEAQIIANDTLRPIYKDSIEAVEKYNEAISSGENTDAVTKTVDALKKKAKENYSLVDGSKNIFKDLFGMMSKEKVDTKEDKRNVSLSLSDWLSASQSGEEGDPANSDLIDSYLEKVGTLKGKLKDLSSITSDDLYELSKSLNDMSFLDIDITTPDGLEEFKRKVISLAKDDFDSLKKSMSHIGDSMDKSNLLSYLEEAGDLTKSLQSNINSATDEISAMENAFSSMNTAYQEFKDKDIKVVSQSSIDGMKETFGSLDYYEKFASIVGNVNSSASECQNAFNKLATEYMYANIQLGHLTKSNKEYYISQMKQMGIANASEVVNSALSKTAESLAKTRKYATLSAKELNQAENELADAGHDLNSMTIKEIEHFLESGNASDIASNSLTKYIAQKELSKATSINENTSINSLLTLANAYGISTTAMSEYLKAKQRLASVNSSTDEQLAGTNKALANQIRQSSIDAMKNASSDAGKSILQAYKKINFSDVSVNYSGDTNNKNKSKDSSKDKFSNSIDWAAQSITKLTRDISNLEDALSNTKGWSKQITYIDKLISKNNELSKAYSKQSSTYKKVYISAAKGLPSSIKKGLETGKKYNLQDFSSEKMYDKYNKAIEYYNLWQDALNNQRSTSRKTSKYKDDKLQVRIDQKNAQLEVKKSEYENLEKTTGKDSKNSNLNRQISLTKEYYSLLISQEKTAEGKAKLRAEREKEIANLVKNQYENLREYYDTLIDINSAKGDYKSSVFESKMAKGSDTAKDRINEYNNQVSTANYNAGKARADAKNILGTYSSGKNKGKARKISDLSIDEQKDYYDTLAKAYGYDKEKYEAQYNAWYENKIQPYENTISNAEAKRDKANNNISLKEAQGKEVTVSDYKEVQKTYEDTINAREKENKLYEERLKYAESNYGKTSSMYIETKKLIDENSDAITQERIEQENLNKTIQEYPINKLKEALEVLESTTSAYEALLSLREVQGKNKTIEELQTQMNNKRAEIVNSEQQEKEAQNQLDNAIANNNTEDINKWKKELEGLRAETFNLKAEEENLLDGILDIRIKALEEEKEAIQKVADAQDRRLKLENAQFQLEKALTQKTKKTIKDGQMVYTTDKEAVKNAQESLFEIQNEEIVNKMDDIIEVLEDMKDDFNIYDGVGNLQKDENGNEITIEQALKNVGINADNLIETLRSEGLDVDKLFKDILGENNKKNAVTITSSKDNVPIIEALPENILLNKSFTPIVPIVPLFDSNAVNAMIANQDRIFNSILSNIHIVSANQRTTDNNLIEIGKIEMHEVSDVKAFAKELENAIPTTFAQVFNKK